MIRCTTTSVTTTFYLNSQDISTISLDSLSKMHYISSKLKHIFELKKFCDIYINRLKSILNYISTPQEEIIA